jgi:hypothetical protein
MRHVCFESLGKRDLLDEALSLMAMVAKLSLSDSEFSSLEFILDRHELDHKVSS